MGRISSRVIFQVTTALPYIEEQAFMNDYPDYYNLLRLLLCYISALFKQNTGMTR